MPQVSSLALHPLGMLEDEGRGDATRAIRGLGLGTVLRGRSWTGARSVRVGVVAAAMAERAKARVMDVKRILVYVS